MPVAHDTTTSETSLAVTVAAGADRAYTVDWVVVSFEDLAAASVSITIAIGGTTLILEYPEASHVITYAPPGGLRGGKNEAIVVTAVTSGLGNKIAISVGYH